MKNLYQFSTSAPSILDKYIASDMHKTPMVKLVYESTQPLKDTQKDTGKQTGLSDSDQDVIKLKNSMNATFKKIVQDSEEEDLDIQTTPAKICGNDKCKAGLSIEWKTGDNGCVLCFGCWEYIQKFKTFVNYKKEIRPIAAKNFNFLKSPRKLVQESPCKGGASSPRQVGSVSSSARKRRQVSAKRNYKESSSDESEFDKKKHQELKRVKQDVNLNSIKIDKTTSIGMLNDTENEPPKLIKNALVWAFLKEKGCFFSALVVSVQIDTVDVLFFQGQSDHQFPAGSYTLNKDQVKFLDLEANHVVFMDHKGIKEEFKVTEVLSDGALLLSPKNKIENLIVGTRHGVYMNQILISDNYKASFINKNKEIYNQIFENVFIIFSLSSNGSSEDTIDEFQDMKDLKNAFIFRGGEIFGIGDNIPENCKHVLCVSNMPNKGRVFLSCLAKKIPIISIGWLQLCIRHEICINPLPYAISSGISELIQETCFPVSRNIYQNLETDRVFECKKYKLIGTEDFVEKWKFILECGGAKIVDSDDAIILSKDSEMWLEQCLIHQYHFGYFVNGCQLDSDIFNVNNIVQ